MADTDVRMEPGWERRVAESALTAMEAAAQIVEHGQRRRIPVSRDGSHGRPPGYARDHIHIERGRDALGPWWDVGSDAETPDGKPYPLFLELGTRRHVIESKGPWPLRNKKTRQVFGRTVRHPGTDPEPWCREALADLNGRRLPS